MKSETNRPAPSGSVADHTAILVTMSEQVTFKAACAAMSSAARV